MTNIYFIGLVQQETDNISQQMNVFVKFKGVAVNSRKLIQARVRVRECCAGVGKILRDYLNKINGHSSF